MAASRRISLMVSLTVLAAAGGLAMLLSARAERELTGQAEAIDGDSLRLSGEELRLRGIDAPELQQECTVSRQIMPCGRDSRAALRRWVSSGLVTCIGSERDRYGRMLVVCRVRGVDINAAMVREGQAVAFGAYEREEREAQAAFRGLWAGEFERPRDWRQRHLRNDRQS